MSTDDLFAKENLEKAIEELSRKPEYTVLKCVNSGLIQ
jgi:alpha-D-ribose 1-methylphosphonate 5-triphosphate synthase subunit PhnG